MLNVNFRVKQLRLGHAHRIFNDRCPSYLSENFVKTSDIHRHNTRGSSWLVVLRLNVPVNNFSVMSGRSHRFLGI